MRRHTIPFFVADRPASLRILKGILLKHPKTRVGLMTHAFASPALRKVFKAFPFESPLVYEDQALAENEALLSRSLVKMADSGIFTKDGCPIDYQELFARYAHMGTDYGVMIDVLRDSKATINSAQSALVAYERNRRRHRFKLVAVAQGNTLEEYLECYRVLMRDFQFIAVGGLVKKRENSARYVTVRDQSLLYGVLEAIKREFRPRWLFALGCYHPSRHRQFERIAVWGSDYKGWIFNYRQKRRLISAISHELCSIEEQTGMSRTLSRRTTKIEHLEARLTEQEAQWRQQKDPALKSAARCQVANLKGELQLENELLLEQRQLLLKLNRLPSPYRRLLASLRATIAEQEQALRFRQVREYIEENVYSQLQ